MTGLYNMGYMYDKGLGVPKSARTARIYYKQSEKSGHYTAGKRLVNISFITRLAAEWLKHKK